MKTITLAVALLLFGTRAETQTPRTWEYGVLTTTGTIPTSWSWADTLRAFNPLPALSATTSHGGEVMGQTHTNAKMPVRSIIIPPGAKLDSLQPVSPPLSVLLNDLGAKGWELVGMTVVSPPSVSDLPTGTYVFKREKR